MRDTVGRHCSIEVAGEELKLLGARAVWRGSCRTLYVADTHFGKPAAFRAAGVPAPEGSTHADLDALRVLVETWCAERLVILGDVAHAPSGQSPATVDAVAQWREALLGVQVQAAPGNHDRRVGDLPASWGIEMLADGAADGPFVLHHEPRSSSAGYVLSGHIHPGIVLRERPGATLRCACFVVEPRYMVLPAFSRFTGLGKMSISKSARVFVLGGDGEVMEI